MEPASFEGQEAVAPVATRSSCTGIPTQELMIADRHVVRAGLRPIFQEFPEAHKPPSESISAEFLQAVKVFNPVAPAEVESHSLPLLRQYEADSSRKDSK